MEVGLLEGVMGRFLSGNPISDTTENQRLLSIKEHLVALFNTRRGSLGHLPDYGLPDISEICDNMPESIAELQRTIKETVDKYEPRLKQVQVLKHEEADENSTAFSVSFNIIAQIVDGPPAYFRARFSTLNPAQVNNLRRRQ
ncbi:MAG: type VI secretion system baseplate subunit TssE [Candidatus Poribacteria bacterium]